MSKEERERTKERQEPQMTNLYVEKLPYSFIESDVYALFSKYGGVK